MSLPLVSAKLKYCMAGVVWPGVNGALRNFCRFSGVRRSSLGYSVRPDKTRG